MQDNTSAITLNIIMISMTTISEYVTLKSGMEKVLIIMILIVLIIITLNMI